MDYGVMTYGFQDRINVGDYIQSIAARQFLPRVDRYICREELHTYAGPPTKVIMNGHFMRYPVHWPPSPNIVPLFTSFHINIRRADGMLTDKGVGYLKEHEPIGCRDLSTLQLLQDKGIESYFSSCLTLTLGHSFRHQSDEDVFFVDVLFRYPTWRSVFGSLNRLRKAIESREIFLLGKQERLLDALFGANLVDAAERVTHVYSAMTLSAEDSRFDLAESLLRRYEKAKLVVTSRIHCALPCLAMGTPVIFVNGGFRQAQARRFTGNSRLFNMVEIADSGAIEANFDLDSVKTSMTAPVKNEHTEYVEALVDRCKQFVREA
ncbi:MAG: polysaccharide pyruvyl transferase family protein [Sedimentisphaerales bacterium]|nr:polysaccharide pyruvyl transferase family protein [Sedimentisphaerales bacterium]